MSPPHLTQIDSAGSHRSLGGTSVPPSFLAPWPLPFVRPYRPRWGPREFGCRHAISVFPPPSPEAGSSSLRTSDSIPDKDYFSGRPRNPRSSIRPHPALPDWPYSNSLIRLPHEPFGDNERLFLRLRFAHSIPPRILWLPERTSHGRSDPFAPSPLQRLPHYYGPVRMPSPATVLNSSRFRPFGTLPLAPTHAERVAVQAGLPTSSRRPAAPPHAGPSRVSARLILEPRTRPSSDAISNQFRHFNSGSLALAFPIPT